jgi:hypothetical protein
MHAIEKEIRTGETMQVGEYKITPQTSVVKILFPGHHAGLIWNRPKGVIVRTSDGQENTLPVRDVTRIVIWAMLAGGLLGAMLIRLMNRNK